LYNLLDMENEINDEQKEILLTLRSLADQNVFVDAVINSICGNFNDLGPVNDKVKRSNVLSTQSSIWVPDDSFFSGGEFESTMLLSMN
jgi:hypothetical protein